MKDFSDEIKNGLKEVQLEILDELDRICEAYGLRYYLAYGSLLGAVRHNGFIPWDDDIDVMMPYNDMVKLETIFNEVADTERFFYQSPSTDSQFGLAINRICRNNSLLIESTLGGRNVHHGIFIDIYPLFGAWEGKIARKRQIFVAMKRALYLYNEPPKHKGRLITFGSKVLLCIKSGKGKIKAYKKLTSKLAKVDFDTSKTICELSSNVRVMKSEYDKEWFGNGNRHQFEDREYIIPDAPDKILRVIYGDYMKLPPVEQRKYHHDYSIIKLPNGLEEKIDL